MSDRYWMDAAAHGTIGTYREPAAADPFYCERQYLPVANYLKFVLMVSGDLFELSCILGHV